MSVEDTYDVSNPISLSGEIMSNELEDYLRDLGLKADAITTISTADATDLATAIALVNEIKDKVNEVITNLRDSGKIDS